MPILIHAPRRGLAALAARNVIVAPIGGFDAPAKARRIFDTAKARM